MWVLVAFTVECVLLLFTCILLALTKPDSTPLPTRTARRAPTPTTAVSQPTWDNLGIVEQCTNCLILVAQELAPVPMVVVELVCCDVNVVEGEVAEVNVIVG